MSRLEELVAELGYENACDILSEKIRSLTGNVLTIVSNKGMHHFPDTLKRGEVYYASTGSFDFSNEGLIINQYKKSMKLLTEKLTSRQWRTIYLVPFGHSTFSMQLKLLVYRVTHIETIDVLYDGKGNYFDVLLDQRELVTGRSVETE